MAVQLGIRELRDNLTATIRRVRAGETIEVTHHGEPVAVLAPIRADRIDRLVAGGEVTAGASSARSVRRFPVTGDVSASQAIEDGRTER